MPISARQYTLIVVLLTTIVLAAAAAGWLARWRGNDLYSATELAIALQRSDGLASTLAVSYPAFKKALYDVRQPDVVVVGSSRGMQFRQSAFRKPFTNLGGGETTPDYGFALLDTVFAKHAPKLLLYAIDYFAYRPTVEELVERPVTLPPAAQQLSLNSIFLVYRLYAEGYLNARQLARLVGLAPLPAAPLPVYGMTASVNFLGGDGADGSSYIVGTMQNIFSHPAAQRFKEALDCLDKLGPCTGPMRSATTYDKRRVAQLNRLLAEFKARGIHVVPFLAPLPPSILQAMQRNGSYGYLDQFRVVMKTNTPEIYDMTDIENLGASDCEFYDPTHAGEIANLRVMLKLSERDSMLAEYLDADAIHRSIANYGGTIIAVSDGPTRALAPMIDDYRDRDVCRATLFRGQSKPFAR